MKLTRSRSPLFALALLLIIFSILSSGFAPAANTATPETMVAPPATPPLPPGADMRQLLTPPPGAPQSALAKPDAATRDAVKKNFGKAPLSFEANNGQTDPAVRFLARGSGYGVFLTEQEMILALVTSPPRLNPAAKSAVGPAPPDDSAEPGVERPARFEVLRMSLEGSNEHPRITGLDERSFKSNYIIGRDRKGWHTDVKNYARVRYENVYPGIDAIYYGKERQIEYDFVVAPGASAQAITLNFSGARGVSIDKDGDLVLRTEKGEIRQHKPRLYQQVGNDERVVDGRYEMKGDNKVGFRVGEYDRSRPLIIDPVLSYTYVTFLGSPTYDFGTDVAVDCAGNAYVTGYSVWNIPTNIATTTGTFLPPGSFENPAGGTDIFVTKLDPEGKIVYSTFIGGNGRDTANVITTDPDGNVYVAGITFSTDFPHPGGLQISQLGAGDALLFELGPAGDTVKYAAVIGGRWRDEAYGVAVDGSGYIYLTGMTDSYSNEPYPFPTTQGSMQPDSIPGRTSLRDGFVLKLYPNPQETYYFNLVYSTRLGGGGADECRAIAADKDGNAYITGYTTSADFQGAPGPDDLVNIRDNFIFKLNDVGTTPLYAARFSPSEQSSGEDLVLDPSRNAYVTGEIGSSEASIVYLKTFNPAGAETYGGELNGAGAVNSAGGIAVDFKGHMHVVVSSWLPNNVEASDVYVFGVDKDLGLLYAQTLASSGPDSGGGIAVDSEGHVLVAGTAGAADFPVTENAVQPDFGDGCCTGFDAFVARLDQELRLPVIFIPGAPGSRLVDLDDPDPYTRNLFPGVGIFKDRLTLDPKDKPYHQIAAVDAVRSVDIPFTNIPFRHVYDKLLEMLTRTGDATNVGGGFTEYQLKDNPRNLTSADCDHTQDGNHPNLFVFPYDWRKGSDFNSHLLKDYVRCVQQFYPDTKINILAHSNGGLLARRYILDYPNDNYVNRLITIGTPWLGAPKAINVFETGEYEGIDKLIWSKKLKNLVEFWPNAAELLPAEAYYAIGGRAMEEEGDFNGNGIPNELYTADQWLDVLDMLHPLEGSRPGTVAGTFHGRFGQDDWVSDTSCIKYNHIIGLQYVDKTIGRVIISNKVTKLRSGRYRQEPNVKVKPTDGDGTVPRISAARVNGNLNLNIPGDRSRRTYVYAQDARHDEDVSHLGMTKLKLVHQDILYLLGLGPKPPDFDKDIEHLIGPSQSPPPAPSGVREGGGQPGEPSPIDALVPDRQPAYYLQVDGTDYISVTDSEGNTNTQIDDLFAQDVPNTGYHLLGDNSVLVIAPSDETYVFTFRATGESVNLELLKGVGNQSPVQAVRYVDLLPPPGGLFRIVTTPDGVGSLTYDADNDGIFETNFTPTASVSGPAASDVEPPEVSISGQRVGQSINVDVTATDADSGVKDLFYSLDGSEFLPYTGPLVIDPAQTQRVYAFADDNVGNRSALAIYDLNAPDDRILFQSDRDGNNEIYTMKPDGSEQTRLTENAASDSDPVWSPDGSKIAFVSNRDGNSQIYVMNADGTGQVRLTADSQNDASPSWSPDATKIAFTGSGNLYVVGAGGGTPTQLFSLAVNDRAVWSPDSTRLAFSGRGDYQWNLEAYGQNIYTVNADGTNLTALTGAETLSYSPSWSPDGNRIAYSCRPTGVYVANICLVDAGGGNQSTLANTGANLNHPVWSPDSTKLAFDSTDQNGQSVIAIVDAGGGTPINITAPAAGLGLPRWSPNGLRLVFASLSPGGKSVVSLGFSDGSPRVNLTNGTDNNSAATWRPSGGPSPPPPSWADLSITNEAAANPAELDRPFNYNISVTNTGPSEATGVIVTDALPGGVTFYQVTSTQGNCTFASGTLSCQLGSLAAGGSAGIVLQVIPRQTGDLSNTASVTAAVADPNVSNNSAAAQTTVLKIADLKVTNTDSADPIVINDQLTYTMLVTNLGKIHTATGVVMTNSLPAGATFVSATTTQGSLVTPAVGSTGTVTANLGSIAVNAQATVTITVRAVQTGTLTSTATVSGNEVDLNPDNNTAVRETRVNPLLQKVLLAKQVLTGGCENTTGNVYLTSPAPPGGASVPLSSNISGVTVPAVVDIPAGATVSPAFTVTTNHVTAKQVGLVTATSGSSSVSRGITINVGNGSCP